MRHQKKRIKLGRTSEHRKALLANQVCSLIEHERIQTTLAKAKAVRPLADKMVTLGKKGSVHARRTALSVLRQKNAVKKLFENIAPRSAERHGGYTRIVKLGQRKSDAAPIAFLEWVDAAPVTEEKEVKKDADAKSSKKKTAAPAEQKVEASQPQPAPEASTAPADQPAAEPSPEPKEPAAPSADEPKSKKRKWFGRKSGDKQ